MFKSCVRSACRRHTAGTFKDTFSIQEPTAVWETPHTQSQHPCRRPLMVYSITLADRLPCYDNLLNTKLNTLFALEDGARSPWMFVFLFWKPVCTPSPPPNGDKWPVSAGQTGWLGRARRRWCKRLADWLWKMKCHLTVSEHSAVMTSRSCCCDRQLSGSCSEY